MEYIIFDLEFNSGKNFDTGKNLNEIIEIGAVKLDELLNETDSFSITIKPKFTRFLNRFVKKLTNITEKELKNSDSFPIALDKFKSWCFNNGDDCIFSSWSNTDLFVLLENYEAALGKNRIGFIKRYFDMQKFVTRVLKKADNNQISLQNAAAEFAIDTEKFSLHRAEDDSRVCCEMFRKTFDKKALSGYISDTSVKDYYKRLTYKPHYIVDISDKNIDKNSFTAKCPYCRKNLIRTAAIAQKYSLFTVKMLCEDCKKKFLLQVKIKKLYEGIEIKKKLKEFTQKQNEKKPAEKPKAENIKEKM